MYGFFEDYQVAIDCVAQLQQHIDSRFTDTEVETPQVSLSLGPYAAVIEVMFPHGEIQLWHSEADSTELSPETLIEIYGAKCEPAAKRITELEEALRFVVKNEMPPGDPDPINPGEFVMMCPSHMDHEGYRESIRRAAALVGMKRQYE